MIELDVFNHTQINQITPGYKSCKEFVDIIIEEMAEDIDGRNINPVRTFCQRLYHFSIDNDCRQTPVDPNDFDKVVNYDISHKLF